MEIWKILSLGVDFQQGNLKMFFLIKQIPKKINQRIQQSKTACFVKCHWDKITAIEAQYQPQVVEHGCHSERE